MNARVTAEGLGKRYRLGRPGSFLPEREIWALREASFAVPAGTLLGVIGPNGAGKTTLLKILGRVTLPTEGRAVVRGRVFTLLEAGAGFQPELTGRENIGLYAALYGIARSEVARKIEPIVEFAELSRFIDTPVKRYSSGMFMRLAFSVAINMDPDVLLADEVLAVGDAAFQQRCLDRVREAGAGGTTVLLVSHDMAAISRLCDRVLWLGAGRVVVEGPPGDVVPQYEQSVWALNGSQGTAAGRHSRAGDAGEIILVELLSAQGRALGAVRVADEVALRTTFRVFHPDTRIRGVFDFLVGNVFAFRTPQPFELQISNPGIYAVEVRVPGHLLAATRYTVDSWVLMTRGDVTEPVMDRHALSFAVFDSDELVSARGTFRHRMPGPVMPRLEWHDVSAALPTPS